jgi:hypothetical protein
MPFARRPRRSRRALLTQGEQEDALCKEAAQEQEGAFGGWVAEETGVRALDSFDVFLGRGFEENVVQDGLPHLCRPMVDWQTSQPKTAHLSGECPDERSPYRFLRNMDDGNASGTVVFEEKTLGYARHRCLGYHQPTNHGVRKIEKLLD